MAAPQCAYHQPCLQRFASISMPAVAPTKPNALQRRAKTDPCTSVTHLVIQEEAPELLPASPTFLHVLVSDDEDDAYPAEMPAWPDTPFSLWQDFPDHRSSSTISPEESEESSAEDEDDDDLSPSDLWPSTGEMDASDVPPHFWRPQSLVPPQVSQQGAGIAMPWPVLPPVALAQQLPGLLGVQLPCHWPLAAGPAGVAGGQDPAPPQAPGFQMVMVPCLPGLSAPAVSPAQPVLSTGIRTMPLVDCPPPLQPAMGQPASVLPSVQGMESAQMSVEVSEASCSNGASPSEAEAATPALGAKLEDPDASMLLESWANASDEASEGAPEDAPALARTKKNRPGCRRRGRGLGPNPKRVKAPLGESDTTLHVSCTERQEELCKRLEHNGFEDLFDFVWVPMKFEDKRGPGKPDMHGYAWVNFISPAVAHRARQYFENTFETCEEAARGTMQVLHCRIQGSSDLLRHVQGREHPEDGKPLFRDGDRMVPADSVSRGRQ